MSYTTTIEATTVERKPLTAYRRVVVKIGSALLVAPDTGLKRAWLESLCDDIARLRTAKTDVVLVSSGAIALGRNVLNLPAKGLKLEDSQAAASVGQIALAHSYQDALARHDLVAAQVLLTLADTEERRRYLNARATITTLLRHGAVPVVNENDTVATSEIRYGDNDRLAARVATMIGADALVLLSDVDGLYDVPPLTNPDANFIAEVDAVTPRIEAMAGSAGTELSRGGMTTKIEAARIATANGVDMWIASGHVTHPLAAIDNGARATRFRAQVTPATARKTWIAGSLEPRGAITLDDGAVRALRSGKSLLPAGVVAVSGSFERGDAVVLRDSEDRDLGRGLIAYDHSDAARIIGRNSRDITEILGYAGRSEMIHRDDMALRPAEPGNSQDGT